MGDLGLDQFSPELFKLLEAASRRRITISNLTKSEAVSMRYKFYQLRAAIRRTADLNQIHMTRCQSRIEPNPSRRQNPSIVNYKGSFSVVCEPVQMEINDAIRAALLVQAPEVVEKYENAPDLLPSDGQPQEESSALLRFIESEPLPTEPPPENEN